MMNAARKTVRYSLIFIALVFALLVAAPFFIDANQYKSLIVDQAEKAIGRHIEIGELHASLFPWVGLRIEDVHIANPKGFAEGDVLQVKSLDVQVALLPLLGGSYQIERFVLDTPKVRLARSADGFSNWEDLLPGAGTSSGDKAGLAAANAARTAAKQDIRPTDVPEGVGVLAAFSAKSLHMNDGEIHFSDAQSGRNIDLKALNIAMDDVQMERPVSLRISGELGGDGFAMDAMLGPVGDVSKLDASRLPFKGHLSVPAAGLANLSQLVSELQLLGEGTAGLDVQLEQRPNGMRVMAGSLSLKAAHDLLLDVKAQMPDANRMQIEQLLVSVDGIELADIKGKLTDISDKMRYELRVSTPELSRLQLSQWMPELQSMYAAHPAPWKTLKLGMLAAGDTQTVDIRDLQLMLNGELVQVSGNIKFANNPDIRLRIASHLLHIDPWLPQPAPAENSGTPQVGSIPSSDVSLLDNITMLPKAHAAAQVPGDDGGSVVAKDDMAAVEPDLRFLKAWKIATVMQVDRLWLHGLDIGRLQANVNGKNGVIHISPMRFELAGGRVEEQASLNVGVYPVTWKEAVKVRDVQLQPVLKALADNDMLSGLIQMDTHLSGRGLLPDAAMTRLNGKGNALLRDGSIKGFDLPGALRNIQNLGQNTGEQKKTDFSQMSGSFNITNGVAKNDDLFIASPLFRLTGYGMVNLVAKQMDYHLKPRLVGSMVGQGDSEAVRKGLEVPIRLIGPLDAPRIQLEVSLESLLGNREAIRDIIKNRKSILNNILQGGGLALPGQPAAQPKAQPQADPSQAPAEQQQTPAQSQPVKPVEQLLKQFLPRF